MHSLNLPPTNYTPDVSFDPAGILSLKGRSLMLDAAGFYEPLIQWLVELETEKVLFIIELDYFNTASSKHLQQMLKIIDGKNNIKEFVVSWGFESDDEETLFKGQILEDRLKKAKFLFKELAGV